MEKVIKIGLLKETKSPVDNRVPLTPQQCKMLMKQYPNLKIVVQSSDIRCFTDEEYKKAGIEVKEELQSCDLLLGVKEVNTESLINDQHYIFFGHIAKLQDYNRSLCQCLISKNITFTDWEYLTNQDGIRLIAFGRWAGIVGAYNALRLYGLRNRLFNLPKPDINSSLKSFVEEIKNLKSLLSQRNLNIMITGDGRVAHGAIELFENSGIHVSVAPKEINKHLLGFNVMQLCIPQLVEKKNGGEIVDIDEFKASPNLYKSRFNKYSSVCDIMISCHFWQNNAPKYLTLDMLSTTKIDTIADVTCDINGSIETTIRPSTHDNPFYAIDKNTTNEVPYDAPNSIGVMAVDTCPNALPRDASEDFGDQIMQYLIPEILKEGDSKMIDRATIIKHGTLNLPFAYMNEYASI